MTACAARRRSAAFSSLASAACSTRTRLVSHAYRLDADWHIAPQAADEAHLVVAGLLVAQRRHGGRGCRLGAVPKRQIEVHQLLRAAALVGRAQTREHRSRQPARLLCGGLRDELKRSRGGRVPLLLTCSLHGGGATFNDTLSRCIESVWRHLCGTRGTVLTLPAAATSSPMQACRLPASRNCSAALLCSSCP